MRKPRRLWASKEFKRKFAAAKTSEEKARVYNAFFLAEMTGADPMKYQLDRIKSVLSMMKDAEPDATWRERVLSMMKDAEPDATWREIVLSMMKVAEANVTWRELTYQRLKEAHDALRELHQEVWVHNYGGRKRDHYNVREEAAKKAKVFLKHYRGGDRTRGLSPTAIVMEFIVRGDKKKRKGAMLQITKALNAVGVPAHSLDELNEFYAKKQSTAAGRRWWDGLPRRLDNWAALTEGEREAKEEAETKEEEEKERRRLIRSPEK